MKKSYLAACAVVLALGVTTVSFAQDTAPMAPETSGPVLPAGVTPPPEGMGQIVFFRPSRMAGMALTYTVRENGQDLGRLPNGRFFVHVAEPGIHEYEIGRNDTMRMEIEPGETYYAMQSIQMGIIAGRAVLSPSDAETFGGEGTHMRRWQP